MCGAENSGKWTCAPCSRDVEAFRRLIRNLQGWRSAFEAQAVEDSIVDHLGRTWVLWDIQRFYDHRAGLPGQMARAIELFLYHNRPERVAAVMMGISPSNPIGVYATVGITRLLGLARASQLSGCDFEFETDMPARVLAEVP